MTRSSCLSYPGRSNRNASWLYVSVRTEGARREAQIHGLDVCADLPESKALLDGVLQSVCNP